MPFYIERDDGKCRFFAGVSMLDEDGQRHEYPGGIWATRRQYATPFVSRIVAESLALGLTERLGLRLAVTEV